MRFKHVLLAALALSGAATTTVHAAAIPLSNGSPAYAQNFNTLTTNSPNTDPWTNDSTLPGWFARNLAGTGADVTGITANNGGNFSSLLSLGSNLNNVTDVDTTGLDRAIGSRNSTGTGNIVFGALFQNTGTTEITSLTITYRGEQYRRAGVGAVTPVPAQDNLVFSYKTSSTLPANAASALGGTFTPVPALDFAAPLGLNTASTSDTRLDGNATGNFIAGITATISGLNIAPNQYAVIRWFDTNTLTSTNAAINDHSLAVDDLNATATFAAPIPEPTSLLAAGALGLFLIRRPTKA